MKRTYEQAFGNHPVAGDVLGDVTFKYLQSRPQGESARPGFVPANCSSIMNMSDCRGLNYETYLNMEECAVLAAAHDIENKRDDIMEAQPQEPRQIKRVKRRIPITIHQNPLVSPLKEEPEPDPVLQGVDLDEKKFEKIEIEYLEKLSSDCKFPISKEKAYIMKKYTDMLLNAVTTEKNAELTRTKAENTVLRKAFKIQNEIVQRVRKESGQIQTENSQMRQKMDQMLYENQLMASKLREYQMQEFRSEYPSPDSRSGWGGDDVAGF